LLLLLAASLLVPGAGRAQAARAGDLRYPPLPKFEIPVPERVVLDNGMVLLLLPDHELPLVEATALVHAGPRYDPAAKAGLASMAAEVMRTGGTPSKSGDEVDDFLESHAASIELVVDDDVTRASLSALEADFADVLRLFADVLRRPALDAGKLEVARAQELGDVARRNEDPFAILVRETDKVLYGADSPLARTPTYATLRAVSRDDLVAWHRASVHPERIVLGISGDFERDEALALVRAAFGDWARGPEWKPPPPAIRSDPARGVFFARKDDVTQSYVTLGHLGLRRDDPDYYAVEILDQLFAGSFASRLVVNVRTKKGLAYAVFGGVGTAWDHPGQSTVTLSTKTETTGAGIDALFAEARDLTGRPPTADEIEAARQAILASFVFRFDSTSRVMNRQLLLEHYGYPRDWLTRYRDGIEKTSADDVRRAARHLRPDDLAIVVVGPATGTDKPLTSYGKVTPLDISLPEDETGGQ
jgi:zinc protease